jgi:hypothetical protein
MASGMFHFSFTLKILSRLGRNDKNADAERLNDRCACLEPESFPCMVNRLDRETNGDCIDIGEELLSIWTE